MVKKKKENAILMIEQEGSCAGIKCEFCPLYNEDLVCAKYDAEEIYNESLEERSERTKILCITYLLKQTETQLEFNF